MSGEVFLSEPTTVWGISEIVGGAQATGRQTRAAEAAADETNAFSCIAVENKFPPRGPGGSSVISTAIVLFHALTSGPTPIDTVIITESNETRFSDMTAQRRAEIKSQAAPFNVAFSFENYGGRLRTGTGQAEVVNKPALNVATLPNSTTMGEFFVLLCTQLHHSIVRDPR